MKIINIKDLKEQKELNVKKSKQYENPIDDVVDYLKDEFDNALANEQKNKGDKENGITK